jgi:hypothetical protein
MFMLGRRWGMLGADIDAWDVPALRVRAAAIVMVVAVSAGLPPPWRPAWHTGR